MKFGDVRDQDDVAGWQKRHGVKQGTCECCCKRKKIWFAGQCKPCYTAPLEGWDALQKQL